MDRRRLLLAFFVGLACASTPTTRARDGCVHDCYPYACRDHRCLTDCETEDDCAPHAHNPEELAAGADWPLVCHASGCVPVDPADISDDPMDDS
jgi:hypothetical protein